MTLEELATCTADTFRYWQGVAATLNAIMEQPGQVTALAATIMGDEEDEKKGIRPELRAVLGLGADHDGDI